MIGTSVGLKWIAHIEPSAVWLERNTVEGVAYRARWMKRNGVGEWRKSQMKRR